MTEETANTPNAEAEALPLVARRGRANGAWLFGIILALAAAALFYTLEARRSELRSPSVVAPRDFGGGTIASPPELAVPSPYGLGEEPAFVIPPIRPQYEQGFVIPEIEPAAPVRRARPAPVDDYDDYDEQPPRSVVQPSPQYRPVLSRPESDTMMEEPTGADRKRLARFDNPSTTVPKGTVIHAVLESALDSTRPGAVRAIVSRDVSSFDGSRVVIPKGSRLLGNYESDLARGQKRALIQWTRLMLPGGAIMELDSPSADPLGRAGVAGKVNSHFFARFGGAILQSVLDIGTQVATRKVGGDTVVLNLPNPAQSQNGIGDDIAPTLKVKHGTSISVFVAHDLDFTGGGR